MKTINTALILILFFSFSAFGRNVMTWIPIYGIDNCKALMNDPVKSEWLKNGLTHIGLQFWVPGDNGEVVFVTDYQFTYKAATIGKDVTDFVTWSKANNVKIMLCLHNVRYEDFDWALTKKVIYDYPEETVNNIMEIVTSYNLDGVDIDFEGIGDFTSDKEAFVDFLNKLGDTLHATGKELSVDIFSTPCYNSPSPAWESAMAPYVDFMNIMGYNETYENDNTLFQYCPQLPSEVNIYPFRYSYIENFLTVKQGVSSEKLNYGLPGWVAEWGGQCAQGNILDIMEISESGGIAIWDLQMNGNGFWKHSDTWELIAGFKNNHTASQVREGLSVCGKATSIEDTKAEASPIIYDAHNKLMKFSTGQGEAFLYSSNGVLLRTWKINVDKEIDLKGHGYGFYILKLHSKNSVFIKKFSINE
ncbi:MAG TPA: glycosyl hydrolase family 18 protein [Cytophagaceae bacterium]